MPRPHDITEQRIQAWTERCGEPIDDGMKYTEKTRLAQQEALYAGFWLEEQLQPLGLAAEQISDSLPSCGQISFGRDPWMVAERVLFLAGEGRGRLLFTPGAKLADDLMSGKLDALFGPGPGVHSPDAVRRLKDALDIKDLTELVSRTGAATPEEAQAKMQASVERLERNFERR